MTYAPTTPYWLDPALVGSKADVSEADRLNEALYTEAWVRHLHQNWLSLVPDHATQEERELSFAVCFAPLAAEHNEWRTQRLERLRYRTPDPVNPDGSCPKCRWPKVECGVCLHCGAELR